MTWTRLPIAQFATPTLAADQFTSLRVDSTGALVTTGGGAGGTTTVVGNNTPSDTYSNPTDALDSWSLLGAWDGTQWLRALAGQIGTVSAANVAKILNVLSVGRYSSGAITLSNGEARMLQLTAEAWLRTCEQQAPTSEDNTNGVYAIQRKPLAVNTYAPTLFSQFGTDPDVSVKATPGNVFSVYCHNINAAARYLQLHNKASAPANPDVPLLTFLIPAQSAINITADFFTENGIYFSTGIAYGFSTTEGTYTAGAAADQFAMIAYK